MNTRNTKIHTSSKRSAVRRVLCMACKQPPRGALSVLR